LKQLNKNRDQRDLKKCVKKTVDLSFVRLIFCRVVKANVGGAGSGLLHAAPLVDLSELTLPDSLDLLFANILHFRAYTEPTQNLVRSNTLYEGHVSILLGTSDTTFSPSTRERSRPRHFATI
jgi:hypothetical protein